MSLPFLPKLRASGCGDPGAEIPCSLALSGGGYLSLPAASAPTASRRLATFDFGVRIYAPGVYCLPFSTNHTQNANYFYFGFDASTGCFRVNDSYGNNVIGFQVATVASFRDPGAHYLGHIEIDTTQPVASDRVRVWINGVLQTLTGTFPPLNYDMAYLGTAAVHYISSWNGVPASIAGGPDIQLSRFVYSPSIIPLSAFGYINRFGVFVPKNFSASLAGGYVLDFADPLALGKDVSGNGRHFTATGLATTNQVTDTPTHGFCTIDPNGNFGWTLSDGGLRVSFTGAGYPRAAGTMVFDAATDAVSWKLVPTYTGTPQFFFGLMGAGAAQAAVPNSYTDLLSVFYDGSVTLSGVAKGDVIASGFIPNGASVELAVVRGSAYLWINGAPVPADGSPIVTGLTGRWRPMVGYATQYGSNATTLQLDFGQRGYLPRPGTRLLCTRDMPCPPIKRPGRYFTTRLRSPGAAVADLPWSPLAVKTLVLSKRRDSATDWRANDTLRPGRAWAPNLATGDFAEADGLTLTPTGFTVGADAAYAGSRIDYVWRASMAAGFDMVLVNHVNGVADVVPHAVGGIIDYAWVVPLGGGARRVYLRALGSGVYIPLNGIGAQVSDSGWFVSSAVDLTLGAALPTGQYALYLWRSVPGFSAFGIYPGNGAADGPFVPLDFAPALFVDRYAASTTENWLVRDTARSPTNPVNAMNLFFNLASADDSYAHTADFVSNGVKLRGTHTAQNASGAVYAFAAWAGTPGKFTRAR